MGISFFIGSSNQSVQYARNIKYIIEGLGHTAVVWDESSRFIPATYTLVDLEKASRDFDAAIFVYGEDDILETKDGLKKVVRDNVILETGLFAGRLGHERILICTSGNPKIPTDLLGLTHVPIEDIQFFKEKLSIWISAIQNTVPSIYKECNIMPRRIADNNPPLSERWKFAKEIWIVNFASTAFLASNSVVNENMARSKWKDIYIKKVLEGCKFKFLLTEPNSFADFDASFSKMVTDPKKGINTSSLISQALKAFASDREKTLKEYNINDDDLIEYKTTDIVLPYGLIMVINDEEHSNLDHIKVDLYSPFLSSDSERRSFIIYNDTSYNSNYDFFERQVRTLWKEGQTDINLVLNCKRINSSDIETSVSNNYRQYFVGDLKREQELEHIYDKKIEVGMSLYKSFKADQPHSHTYATEFLYILSGTYKLCIKTDMGLKYEELNQGDFFAIPKLTPYASKACANTKVLFIKAPGLNDKVDYKETDFNSFLKQWEEQKEELETIIIV